MTEAGDADTLQALMAEDAVPLKGQVRDMVCFHMAVWVLQELANKPFKSVILSSPGCLFVKCGSVYGGQGDPVYFKCPVVFHQC